jgi:hypothetical protein
MANVIISFNFIFALLNILYLGQGLLCRILPSASKFSTPDLQTTALLPFCPFDPVPYARRKPMAGECPGQPVLQRLGIKQKSRFIHMLSTEFSTAIPMTYPQEIYGIPKIFLAGINHSRNPEPIAKLLMKQRDTRKAP